jgi:hypothetical protein
MKCTLCGVSSSSDLDNHTHSDSGLRAAIIQRARKLADLEMSALVRELDIASAKRRMDRIKWVAEFGTECAECGDKFAPLPDGGPFCSVGCSISAGDP